MLRQICLHVLAIAPVFGLAFATQLRADPETTVSGPHTHHNLSVYFIHGKSADGPVPLTLEEALAKGLVEVHETGEVSRLTLENKSKEEVFIHAGDIVKGGKQDRVVTSTLVLPPKSGKIDASVYCVEAGRWAARGREDVMRFSASAEMMPTKDARMALMNAPSATAGLGAVGNAADPSTGDRGNDPNRSYTEPSQRTLETASTRGGGQTEVWSKVAEIQTKLSGKLKEKVNDEKSESSLQLALENKKLNEEREGYIKSLEGAPAGRDDIIGYAIAVNGEIASADVYASNALFKKLWPRLLKAAVTEAISADEVANIKVPETAGIQAFLARDNVEEHKAQSVAGATLATRNSEAAFDAETRSADGKFLHRAKLKR